MKLLRDNLTVTIKSIRFFNISLCLPHQSQKNCLICQLPRLLAGQVRLQHNKVSCFRNVGTFSASINSPSPATQKLKQKCILKSFYFNVAYRCTLYVFKVIHPSPKAYKQSLFYIETSVLNQLLALINAYIYFILFTQFKRFIIYFSSCILMNTSFP